MYEFEPSLSSQIGDWLYDKLLDAVGAGGAKAAEFAAGMVLSYFGFGGPDLADVSNQLRHVQETLHDLEVKIRDVTERLDGVLLEVQLSRNQIIDQLNLFHIEEAKEDIQRMYDDLVYFVANPAEKPDSPKWAEATAKSMYDGQYDMEKRLDTIQNGILGGGGIDGVLAGHTNLLLARLAAQSQAKQPVDLLKAYRALEYLFSELLAVQVKGLLLYTEALNWRDRDRKRLESQSPDSRQDQLAYFPGTADSYVRDRFKPQLQKQMALFLKCVDRLILSQVDLRTRTCVDGAGAKIAAQLLPPSAPEIYWHADLLARRTCREAYPHEIVVRLVGDPSLIEDAVKQGKQPSLMRVGAYDKGASPSFTLEVAPVCDQPIAYYEGSDVNLPVADFPTREYLEWYPKQADGVTCRPQTKVAVARLGLSESLAPRTGPHPETFRLFAPAGSEYVGQVGYYDSRTHRAEPGSEDSWAFGHYVLAMREQPKFEEGVFRGNSQPLDPRSDRRYELPLFTDKATPRLLLSATMKGEASKVLAAKFKLVEYVEYKKKKSGYIAPHGFKAGMWKFRYTLCTTDKTKCWLLFQHVDQAERMPPGPIHALKQDTWAPITRKSDHPAGASTKVYLRHHDNTARHDWGFSLFRKPAVLNRVFYWLEEVELTLMQAEDAEAYYS